MRRIALAKSPLAEADPEPLTLANLTTKSLMRIGGLIGRSLDRRGGNTPLAEIQGHAHRLGAATIT